MIRVGILAVASLMVLGGCSVPSLEALRAERGVPISVNYTPSFKTGCIVMRTQDEAKATNSTEQSIGSDSLARQSPPLVLKVLRKADWGALVKVTIRAHEQTCEGKEVDRAEVPVDLSGEGSQQPLSVTLNTPDEDGDGYVAVLGDGKGGTDCDDRDRTRNPAAVEVCDNKDNNCDGSADEGLNTSWYLDEDGDGVPRGPDFVSSCTSPSGNYIQYPAAGPFDCRDFGLDAAKMFPGNSEKCDNVDNNCNNIVDEGYAATGETCNSECGGMTVCSGDGNAVVCSRDPGRYYYRDVDGDGDGDLSATAVLKCESQPPDPGYVLSNHGDCDDVDPAASSSRAEVCDAIDNNCDGLVDNTAVSCGGTLKDVVNHHVGGNTHDWRTVSTGPNGYPVWIAGRGGKLAVRRTASGKFESFSFGDATGTTPDGSLPASSNNCGNTNWTVSWVNSTGVVFLGGEGGMLAIHAGNTAPCGTGALTVPSDNLTGMVGFETGGETTIYITDTAGRLIKWVVGGNPQHSLVHDNNINVYGVHGLSESLLLVSGGNTAGDIGQAFQSYTSGTPSSLHATLPDNGDGTANAVWMGKTDKACAVGDDGLAWRWDGATTWHRAESSGTTSDFSSVVMRYDAQNTSNPLNDQCYIVDKGANGKLRRLTPFGWAKGPDLPSNRANVPLRDIAITATGELWIVGDDGRVFHYPEP
ncbi:putative metal-binding motif-containing protein [Myxococcus sp. AM011]|uniref:putative metal-binding motif-containing protein n=1 Tax=Myxococcus sp. AM011 TaxID=2745200 RepID=UPI001595C989|nr:putative metal-binding motif-containing protein [Myxococcus sp. AM011]NVJ28456.1 putative metal-binding motif-containing protein [Myxococcus sp. AM011]